MISTHSLAVFGLGMPEMIIILVILLVLFGGAKLPGLAKGIGQSIKEFKKASKEEPESEAPKPVATATPVATEKKP
jgi:sec-independent protein translocase protein TatA